eukprot:13612-Heterococcus_DN1.PRE.2
MYMRWLACLRICWILQAIAILDCSDAQPCGFKPTFKVSRVASVAKTYGPKGLISSAAGCQ